ncbi:MAG: 4-(cytidine 5'-diphospho)-2-C-methyl-D-erythritol kinase, partial [Pseudomonadota bacterium]
APELTRNTPAITLAAFLKYGGRNDCEPVVRRRYPEVAAALDWLSSHAHAQLTGTGSCIFAAFATEAEATRIAALTPSRWVGFVVRGLTESPV